MKVFYSLVCLWNNHSTASHVPAAAFSWRQHRREAWQLDLGCPALPEQSCTFTISELWLPPVKPPQQGWPLQSTRSQANSELYTEISGKDLNGKAFALQEDINFLKYNSQGTNEEMQQWVKIKRENFKGPRCMRYDKEVKHKRKAAQAGVSENPRTGLWGTADCITTHSKGPEETQPCSPFI